MPVRNAAESWMTLVCCRQWANFAGEAAGPEPCADVFMNSTSRFGSGYGTGFSSTAFTTEKIAVFTPIPSARAATAATVNAQLCRNIRRQWCTSFIRASTTGLLAQWHRAFVGLDAGEHSPDRLFSRCYTLSSGMDRKRFIMNAGRTTKQG